MLLNAADYQGYRLKSYLNSVLFRNVTHNNALQSNYNSQFYTSIKVKHNFANIKFFLKSETYSILALSLPSRS